MNDQVSNAGRALVVCNTQLMPRITAIVAGQGWSAVETPSPRDALRTLRADDAFDLVILSPDEAFDVYIEMCRSIKFDSRTGFLSVVLLLEPPHFDRGAEAFNAGADDCIRTVASDIEIALRLHKTLALKRAADSLEDATAVITSLANAIEGKDHYTCGHVERVGAYCVEIGRRIGVDAEGLVALKTGGIVHDIGKIGIPDHILNKPGKLTDEEFAIMRRHPAIGHDILKPLRTFRDVLPIVRWHHERPNGTGYPDGLRGEQIPLLPRIAAVADVFDALITDRPYRKAFSVDKCRQILVESADRGELDSVLVEVLSDIIARGASGVVHEAA